MKIPPIMSNIPIGIVGGSGLYHMEALESVEEIAVDTPFGKTSDLFRVGTLGGRRVAFLARHGRHHSLSPSEIPHRANIWAFKKLGVRWLMSLSAVGSLKENLHPRDFVFPLQFVDKTKRGTEHSFFGKGIVAHISFARPVCETLATLLFQSATSSGAKCHWGGTYVNMEGPAFSTRAECDVNRKAGFDVIGMTNLAEAKLSREAQISYATISMVTDYDCWHQTEAEVSVAEVGKVLRDNASLAQKTILHAVQQVPLTMETRAHRALENAILTPKEYWPAETKEMLGPILAGV